MPSPFADDPRIGPTLRRVFGAEGAAPSRPVRLPPVVVTPEVTPVPLEREADFRRWVKRWDIRDLDDPRSYYDYRGAFLGGVGSEISSVDGLPHWPDTYKQHGHPTFSVESKYSSGPLDGGRWGGPDGETYVPQPTPIEPSTQTQRVRRALDPLEVQHPDNTRRVQPTVRSLDDLLALFALSPHPGSGR